MAEKKFVRHPALSQALQAWIEGHKAGSPTEPGVYWIHLRARQIAAQFGQETGFCVSQGTVRRLLRSMGFRYRSLCKSLPTGSYAGRDRQFQVICQLVLAMSLNSPVISMDCKKKEVLGQLHRAGKCATLGKAHVYDHDYQHLAQGKVVPHGIYDLQRNEGYISIGTSHETAAFVADNLRWWWETFGIHYYPDAQNILILCDAGGANSYRHHTFKKEMLLLAQTIGKDLIICHYPPYASKWNPIEHRLFAHVHRAMQGTVLYDYDIVQTLIGQTSTQTGLKVFPRIVRQHYPIGINTTKSEIDYSRVYPHYDTPDLTYRIAA